MTTPYAATLQCPDDQSLENGKCFYTPVCKPDDIMDKGKCIDTATNTAYAPFCRGGEAINPKGMCLSSLNPVPKCNHPTDSIVNGLCYPEEPAAPATPPPTVTATTMPPIDDGPSPPSRGPE